jgi:hypothetical protein
MLKAIRNRPKRRNYSRSGGSGQPLQRRFVSENSRAWEALGDCPLPVDVIESLFAQAVRNNRIKLNSSQAKGGRVFHQ